MGPKIYFGHPINVYDTALEAFLLQKIESRFPNYHVENPNQKCHNEGYQRWKQETGKGMDYYFKIVLPQCIDGVFLPFRDGKWGAGVFGEAEFLASQLRPIYKITPDGVITPTSLSEMQPDVLSVADTVARIRTPDGKTVHY